MATDLARRIPLFPGRSHNINHLLILASCQRLDLLLCHPLLHNNNGAAMDLANKFSDCAATAEAAKVLGQVVEPLNRLDFDGAIASLNQHIAHATWKPRRWNTSARSGRGQSGGVLPGM